MTDTKLPLNKIADAKAAIAKAKRDEKEIRGWADSPKGFLLRAWPSGKATYYYRYVWHGKPVFLKVAGYSEVSLKRANDIALDYASDVRGGIDPREAKRAAKAKARQAQDTVAAIGERWLKHYGNVRKPKSLAQARTVFNHYIMPKLGNRPIALITPDDIRKLLNTVPAEKGAMARAVYSYARIFFEWAYGEGHVASNPVADMPKVKRPAIPKARKRFLSHDEVQAFWQSCATESPMFRALFRLLLSTGQRREEVAGMAWGELDRVNRIWEVPAARAKNDQDHTVHLNEPAIAELDVMANGSNWPSDGLVFTTTGKSPASGITKPKIRISATMGEIEHWRTHDLRRTLATHCGELGEGEAIIELALNHKGKRAGLIGVYQGAERLPERKAMFELWGAALLEVADGKRPNTFRDEFGELDLDLWRRHCLNRREAWRKQWGEDAKRGEVARLKVAG